MDCRHKNLRSRTARAIGLLAIVAALGAYVQVPAYAAELDEQVRDAEVVIDADQLLSVSPTAEGEAEVADPADDVVPAEVGQASDDESSAADVVSTVEPGDTVPTDDGGQGEAQPVDDDATVLPDGGESTADAMAEEPVVDAPEQVDADTVAVEADVAETASEAAGAAPQSDSASQATSTKATPAGTFAIETGLGYGIVADVKGGSTSNKANVQIYRSNNTSAQRWRLEFHGNVCYVVNVKSGKVLDVAGGKAAKGANVQLYKANGSKAQLWVPEQLPNGGWVLRSALNSNYVLDVAGGSIANGSNLRLWTANGSRAQSFWFRETDANIQGTDRVIEDGTYVITTALTSNRALDVKGGSDSKGANIQLYNNNGSNAQRFYVTYVDGFYTFQNVTSGLALDLYAASPVAGANIQLWNVNHSKGQQWSVVAVGDGVYHLVNRASGLVVDLAGGRTDNGTNIRGYYGNGSGAQTWSFWSTTMLAPGFYTLQETSGNVLDIKGGSTQAGAAVQRHAANRSMAQNFIIDCNDEGEYEIRNVGSAKWLSDNGTSVVQSSTEDRWELVWNGLGITLTNGTTYLGFNGSGVATMVGRANAATIHPHVSNLIDPGYYQFKNLLGTVLDTSGQSKTMAYAVTNNAGASVSQIWYVSSRGNGNYSLINMKSGLALGVVSATKANGVRVNQNSYKGTAQQLWKIDWDNVNGGLVLVNAATGLVLDVAGGSNKAGANVQQYRSNYSAAQSWHLVDKTVPAIVERIAQVAEHFASDDKHGYSIPNRGCGTNETITLADGGKVTITNSDIDCSEMVRQCINGALAKTVMKYLDTRIEDTVLKALGFVRIAFSKSALLRGDILWVSGHTGVYVGDGKQADAYQDEYGNLEGPNKGDQTGHEVEVRTLRTTWTYIYRYTA